MRAFRDYDDCADAIKAGTLGMFHQLGQRTAAVLLLPITLMMLFWAGSAFAVPGLVIVNGTVSASDSSTFKTATASCTGITKIFGTGAVIAGGSNRVLIQSIVPNSTLTSVTVTAYEDRNTPLFTSNWSLQAQVICGNPVSQMSLKKVKFAALPSVSDTKTVNAVCSVDGTTKAYGTGFEIATDLTPGDIFVNTADVSGDLAFVSVFAAVDDNTVPTWNLTAYAICGAPVAGLDFRTGSVGPNTTSPKTPTAACPVGTSVHGLGYSNFKGASNAVFKDLIPVSLFATTLTGSAQRTAAENDVTNELWTARITVVCAP